MERNLLAGETRNQNTRSKKLVSTMLATTPIFVTFRLINKETGEINSRGLCDFPIMTEMALSSSMVVNVLSEPGWSAHQVFTLMTK